MPFVNVKVTGGTEAPATTMVIINEIEIDNWGIAGKITTELRQEVKK